MFDPHEWSQVYDSTTSADAYVLRRTSALAVETVRALRRPGERWLDLGCGPGHATALLANEGDSIVGADADPRMLYAARERGDELELVAAHAESLPFASGSFHGVVAISLTGCLAAPEECFLEVCRVLRPNGTAVITFTNRASWLLRLNYRLPWRWVTSAAGGQSRHKYHLFVAAEVRSRLERSGFTVQRLLFYNYVLHIGRWLIPSRKVATRLDRYQCDWLARNFLVVARKRAPVARSQLGGLNQMDRQTPSATNVSR
jgi:ubiquinone/menaquinone biosynthesis C-methylase UbiE